MISDRVDESKGDPANTLSRTELEEKALRLAKFSGAATAAEMRGIFEHIWTLTWIEQIGTLLAPDGIR